MCRIFPASIGTFCELEITSNIITSTEQKIKQLQIELEADESEYDRIEGMGGVHEKQAVIRKRIDHYSNEIQRLKMQ